MVKLDVMDGKAANPSSVERDVNILKANAIPLREIINFTVDMRTIILVTASFLGMTGWLLGLFMAAVVLCGAAIIAVSLTEAFAQLDISKISRLAVKEGVPPAAHFAQSQGVKR
jgi:hypothetical protein